jgi:glycosyltransferase involved in cell wall biosynthesis
MACGTPVAAFNLGGLPDIVDHTRTGWLAKPEDVSDLSQGLAWLLNDPQRLHVMSEAARESAVNKFSPKEVVKQYVAVYAEAIAAQSR